MNPSGTGRFIADSWFADEPLPPAYTHPAAKKVRESGGVSAKQPDKAAIDAYLAAVDVKGAIDAMSSEGKKIGGLRGAYFEGLGVCFSAMWDLVQEILGRGEPVPYERCVIGSTGKPPEPSHPEREARARRGAAGEGRLPVEVGRRAAHRRGRLAPRADGARQVHPDARRRVDRAIRSAGTAKYLAPHLPQDLAGVPLANMKFLPIKDAWFSGSMNYIGRARKPDGTPEYEATYEINASLQISRPGVRAARLPRGRARPRHDVGRHPGSLRPRRLGIRSDGPDDELARRGAHGRDRQQRDPDRHGVTEVEELPDDDMQLGVLLALLQDDAKNQSSWLTWKEGVAQKDVAATLRRDYLVSEERADKLSGAWGRHPLLGRMYLPCYRAGTEAVADLRRRYPAEKVLPALYGCRGLVDVVTVRQALS